MTMRFLRSVARVFVILSVEMASSKRKSKAFFLILAFVFYAHFCVNDKIMYMKRFRRFLYFPFCSSNFIPQPIGKCKRVFQALLPYAVEELCNVAESLIVPVRMGI